MDLSMVKVSNHNFFNLLASRRNWTQAVLQDLDRIEQSSFVNEKELCEQLFYAQQNLRHITILPDFDADGISAGILGYAGLSLLGFQVSLYIPDNRKGYGFTPETIDDLLSKHPQTEIILTCDVGQTCYDAVRAAQAKEIAVWVTDHHQDDPSILHSAQMIVNPSRSCDPYPDTVCGSYVMYHILQTFVSFYAPNFMADYLRYLCAFAGIGTLGDMMPMIHNSRAAVKEAQLICSELLICPEQNPVIQDGLKDTHPAFLTAMRGLQILLKKLYQQNKVYIRHGLPQVDEEFLQFYICPLFNLPKRVDKEVSLVFDLFMSPEGMQEQIADYLLDLNQSKKQTLDFYGNELKNTEQPFAPYIYLSSAPGGILGLLANQMMNQTKTATLVVNATQNGWAGSGRTFDGCPVFQGFRQAGLQADGHECAFGIQLPTAQDFNIAYSLMRDRYNIKKPDPVTDLVLGNVPEADYGIGIDEWREFVADVDLLRPFGPGFQKPNIRLCFTDNCGDWQIFGKNRNHLKITICGIEIICWNQAAVFYELQNRIECGIQGRFQVEGFFNRPDDDENLVFSGKLSLC